MEDLNVYLLGLYRLARETDAHEFQSAVVKGLHRSLCFESAFWGNARQPQGASGPLVPTALHVDGIDPDFSAAWTRACPADPMMPILQRCCGGVFEVSVPTFYSPTPELSDLGRRHRIQSYIVGSVPGLVRGDLQWLSLFRSEPDAHSPPQERAWFANVLPHLNEAWRINQMLHARDAQTLLNPEDWLAAVAERRCGTLIKSDARMVSLLSREWTEFDGHRVARQLQRAWLDNPVGFSHQGRTLCCRGRCVGDLVYLLVRDVNGSTRLTPRQWQIARAWAAGQSHKEIARLLGLSPITVRNHLAGIYAVLDIHSRSALSSWLDDQP